MDLISTIMSGTIAADKIRMWFRRMDYNNNGIMSWDEFSDYIVVHQETRHPTENITRKEYTKVKFKREGPLLHHRGEVLQVFVTCGP